MMPITQIYGITFFPSRDLKIAYTEIQTITQTVASNNEEMAITVDRFESFIVEATMKINGVARNFDAISAIMNARMYFHFG